jgi:hypothetical protein
VSGVVCLGLGGPLATAEASTPTVYQAISSAERSARSNTALSYLLSHQSTFETAAGRKTDLPRVETVSKLYAEISRYVSHSTASSATQKTARVNWVRGTALASQEYAALATELRDLQAQNTAGAMTSSRQAVALGKRATFDIDKADRLLGLAAGT